METQNKLLLAYWNVRGRAESIRLLLSYLGAEFDEQKYKIEKYEEWFMQDKPKLGVDYPNLPYLRDGDTILTESESICLYLCNKFNRMDLIGVDIQDRVNIAKIKGVVDDIRLDFGMICYDPQFEKVKDQKIQKMVLPRLERVDKALGEKGPFLNDGKLCYYDFYFYDICQVIDRLDPKLTEKYTNILQQRESIGNFENIKKYLASDKFEKDAMLFGPTAKWRG